jgi:hypothetical protein
MSGRDIGIRTLGVLRTTVETKLHIDPGWWEEQGRDLRLSMYDRLCPECKMLYASYGDIEDVDWIDDETAEVTRVDALSHTLRTCCSTKPDYITEDMPFVEAVFRLFLANGNTPLSALELHQALDRRPANTILRMLTKARIYNGIKPVADGNGHDGG